MHVSFLDFGRQQYNFVRIFREYILTIRAFFSAIHLTTSAKIFISPIYFELAPFFINI